MARPVHAKAEATRARILEQAMRLFAERGVGESSIRDIARASGVSLAMVHHYFGSKERLLHECIDTVYAELATLQREFEPLIMGGGRVDELLPAAVIKAFHFARERRELIRLLMRVAIASGGYTTPEGRARLSEYLDRLSTLFGLLLDRPPHALRLGLRSVVFLIARYAVQRDEELAWVVGSVPEGSSLTAVEWHLAEMAQLAIVGVPLSQIPRLSVSALSVEDSSVIRRASLPVREPPQHAGLGRRRAR